MTSNIGLVYLVLHFLSLITTIGALPIVTELSLSPSSQVSAVGSLQGGTLVYVKGSGFTADTTQVQVLLGPYLCIPEINGIQDILITCRTTKATSFNLVFNLPTKVTVNGSSMTCSMSSNCLFSYQSSKTPFIQEIYQRTSTPNEFIYSFGTFKISNNSDIEKVMIGDQQCNLTGISQSINPLSRSPIKCRVSSNHMAGEYNISVSLRPGYPTMSLRTVQTSSFSGKNYTQRIAAEITNFSSRKCGFMGTQINVTGSGFSSNISNYTCSVAGENCVVTQASLNQLTIEIPRISINNYDHGKLVKNSNDNSIQQGAYLGNNGLSYKRYSLNGMSKSGQDWLTYLRSANVTNTLLEERVLKQLSLTQSFGQYYVEYFKGYFFVPVDGEYSFMAMADDSSYIKMSNVSNNSNPANLQMIINANQQTSNRYNSYVRRFSVQTQLLRNMTKGFYYMEGVCINQLGERLFKLVMDMPALRTSSGNPAWEVNRIFIWSSLSASLSGSFQMFINGIPLVLNSNPNLPFSIAPEQIASLLNSFYQCSQINVWRRLDSDPFWTIQFIIQYVGLYSPALPITLNTSLIVPSVSSSTILKSVEIVTKFQNREHYSPVPFDFLYMASNNPILRLTVNSIPIVCANCTFQYIPSITPVLTCFSRYEFTYQMSLSDPTIIGFQLSDLNITVHRVPCVNLTGTISNFTCSVSTNSDGSAALPAGTEAPQILVNNVGFVDSTTVTPETISLIVTSFQPAQTGILGILGGVEATILGSGFPISYVSAASLNISICGNFVPMANVTYISNQKLKLIIPAELVLCNGYNNLIKYNGQQSGFTFSYNPCLAPKDIVRCQSSLGFNFSDSSRQNFVRVWSNAAQWPNQVLPASNSRVEVPYEWNLLLDMSTPVLNYLEINGNLIFDNSQNITLQSHFIWVKKGTIIIGSVDMPYSKYANIVLHGEKDDFQIVVDKSASGNKILAVTGRLEFYGQQPGTPWTRLTRTASVGDNQILVSSCSGWKVGDRIVIAPSYSRSDEFEQVIITDVNGNLISFVPPLLFEHYGAPSVTISNRFGVIDSRSAVGLLTRNIRISSAASATNWEGRILIYGYQQNNGLAFQNGYAKLRGVQIQGCGQLNTTVALRIQNVNIYLASSQTQTIIQNSVIMSVKAVAFQLTKPQTFS